MINALFSENEIPKEINHYICTAAICIDSVLKIGKKNYPQVYLEQCKYKIKRRKQVDFTDAEVDLSSDNSDNFGDLDEYFSTQLDNYFKRIAFRGCVFLIKTKIKLVFCLLFNSLELS